jgi:hypothetical protein
MCAGTENGVAECVERAAGKRREGPCDGWSDKPQEQQARHLKTLPPAPHITTPFFSPPPPVGVPMILGLFVLWDPPTISQGVASIT